MRQRYVSAMGALMVILPLVLTTCSEDDASTLPPSNVSFAGAVQPILTTRCVNAGCHPGGGAPFSLRADSSYILLVGDTATVGACAGTLLRVRPSSADSSAIIRRLEGTSCGPQMPFGLAALPQSEITLIRTWINEGAANN